MMTGTITNRRAHINLPIRGPGGSGNVEFTIDTGYTALMTLPAAACIALKFPYVGRDTTFLADGTPRDLDYYKLIVEWDGKERNVDIIAIDSEPLIGMTLLDGYDVFMGIRENGVVRIQESADGNSA
jgi:clan AA aspartic protease